MEPVSVATPTYRIPGVRDSSGALKLFIRPIIITEPFSQDNLSRSIKSKQLTLNCMFNSNPFGDPALHIGIRIAIGPSHSFTCMTYLPLEFCRGVDEDQLRLRLRID